MLSSLQTSIRLYLVTQKSFFNFILNDYYLYFARISVHNHVARVRISLGKGSDVYLTMLSDAGLKIHNIRHVLFVLPDRWPMTTRATTTSGKRKIHQNTPCIFSYHHISQKTTIHYVTTQHAAETIKCSHANKGFQRQTVFESLSQKKHVICGVAALSPGFSGLLGTEPSALSCSRTDAIIALRGRRSLERVTRACLTSPARTLVLKKRGKRKLISDVILTSIVQLKYLRFLDIPENDA